VLVRITDRKGNDCWINPLYVKAIRPHKKGYCEVVGPFSQYGGSIKTDESAESLADRLSVSMPDSPAWKAMAGQAVADEEDDASGGAATSTAMLG
jgi:hypothetical protein